MKLTQEEELYVKQMHEWLKEQERLENQLKRTIDDYTFLAASNAKQLELHQERVALGRKEFEQWKAEHQISEVND